MRRSRGEKPYHRRIVRDLKLLGAVAFASWRFGDLEIWRLKIFQIILPNSEPPNLPVAKAILISSSRRWTSASVGPLGFSLYR